MRSIGISELETRLSDIFDAVEHGETVIVMRYGNSIARIVPSAAAECQQVSRAVQSLLDFPRTRLPRGITIRGLIGDGRR